jgi:hypothetical protein
MAVGLASQYDPAGTAWCVPGCHGLGSMHLIQSQRDCPTDLMLVL